jgi:hypothetical protein
VRKQGISETGQMGASPQLHNPRHVQTLVAGSGFEPPTFGL